MNVSRRKFLTTLAAAPVAAAIPAKLLSEPAKLTVSPGMIDPSHFSLKPGAVNYVPQEVWKHYRVVHAPIEAPDA